MYGMSKHHLAIYLNDHLAGSQAALEILDRLGEKGAALKSEIEQDVEVLKNLMAILRISQSPIRKATGWVGEKLLVIKNLVDDRSGGPLAQLEMLEALSLGIEGKLALWLALDAATSVEPALAILTYDRLAERALKQRAEVERWRLEAAKAALMIDQAKAA
jgi:hypothetical protein